LVSSWLGSFANHFKHKSRAEAVGRSSAGDGKLAVRTFARGAGVLFEARNCTHAAKMTPDGSQSDKRTPGGR
jgi:hypothetical protein